MKYEVVCDNRACTSNIPLAIMGDEEEVFHHVMLSSSDSRCPACGSASVRVTSTVPDSNRFPLGAVVKTPSIDRLFGYYANEESAKLIDRHVTGDWGDVGPEAMTLNDNAVGSDARPRERGRLMSSYEMRQGTVWVITEAGRHTTTVLLPEDY